MIEARFHPLDLATWPGTPTPPARRKGPQFRSSWSQTLTLLEDELRHLRAKDIVIQADFTARDIRQDGWPRADARKPSFPGVVVSFQSNVGPLTYATDIYSDGYFWRSQVGSRGEPGFKEGASIPLPGWQANVRAIALSLEALRAVDRHGVTKRGEQYVGFGALPRATLALDAPMSVEEAADVLGVDLGERWDSDFVTSQFRQKAREADASADPAAALHRVQKARDVLLESRR